MAKDASGAAARALSRDALEIVLGVTRALAAPFELDSMLHAVAAAARRVLAAERSSVWLLDAATGELVTRVSVDLPPIRLPLHRGLVGVCATSRQVINVPDCYADARFDPSVDRAAGFRTRCALALPLIDHRGVLVGVLQILNKNAGVFDADDEALAQALAAQCAIALTRVQMTAALIESERIKRDLELARLVQQSSLPAAMPVVPGYDLYGVSCPAEETGGDTFDLAPLERGLLVFLGDACGHGIAPSLTVMQMHAMLRMAFRLGADLETVFHQANDQLEETLRDGRFVTAFVGLLDPARHVLRYLSGGQGPIVHFDAATGACRFFKATSFPMGAMALPRVPSPVSLALAPGDLVVLLSDGIYEYADAAGAQFGRARVEAIVRAHHTEPMAALGTRLLDAARQFAAGAPQEDDVTMVLIKRVAA